MKIQVTVTIDVNEHVLARRACDPYEYRNDFETAMRRHAGEFAGMTGSVDSASCEFVGEAPPQISPATFGLNPYQGAALTSLLEDPSYVPVRSVAFDLRKLNLLTADQPAALTLRGRAIAVNLLEAIEDPKG